MQAHTVNSVFSVQGKDESSRNTREQMYFTLHISMHFETLSVKISKIQHCDGKH